MKFLIFRFFSDFYLILIWFFVILLLIINRKKGVIYRRTAELAWHGKLMWCVEPARMRRGTQGHVAEPREPAQGLGGVDTWQGPCGRPGGAMWQSGAGIWRAHGLVGPGYRIEAVTQ